MYLLDAVLARILILLGVVATAVALLWVFQRSFIYFPVGSPGRPNEAGLPDAKEVAFATEDGLTLRGWFVPAEEPPPVLTVLVFNGNGGNRAFRAPLAAALSRAGFDTLLFDYRGYGGQEGRPTEPGLAADARAAWRYLVERAGANPNRIALLGESLGTGVAVRLALEQRPAALVLRSPFTSIIDVARPQFFFLPLRWMLWDQYRSLDCIGRIACPLLVIAGTRDSVVPYDLSVRLYNAAPAPKRMLTLDADHNDLEMLAGERLVGEVARFLESVAKHGGAAGASQDR